MLSGGAERGGTLKRLGGWDAVFLYNETPNLRQHALENRLARRVYLLEPLRYQLVAIPRRLHRAM